MNIYKAGFDVSPKFTGRTQRKVSYFLGDIEKETRSISVSTVEQLLKADNYWVYEDKGWPQASWFNSKLEVVLSDVPENLEDFKETFPEYFI